ncbi:metalloprotease family protein [Spirosoma arboris]|nr:metalloprotease family protein [Spirosoma arboris]
MSALRAQIYGLVAFCLGTPLLLWPYDLIWEVHLSSHIQLSTSLWFGLLMIMGMLAHELIHGLTAVWYGRVSWQDTKFGVQWQSLTPYFHSTVPLKAQTYRVVVVKPQSFMA